MTVFHSHHDELGGRIGAGRSVLASVIDYLSAALKIIHRAIMTAKMRRLPRELALYRLDYAPETHDPDRDVAKIPRRPLLLGDKWDF